MKHDSMKSLSEKIIQQLDENYPHAVCALTYGNPLEILIATILSAQCTDERVNKVTPSLFRKYPNALAYANASQAELEKYIHSTGFYRNKAKNIQGACQMIMEKFEGKVPKNMEEILKLPGVARKTANVVLQNAYGVVEGITVDTHVRRLSNRLGLSEKKVPEKIEQDLLAIVPPDKWGKISYQLIDHGRKICKARKPNCKGCFLNKLCPSAFKVEENS